MATRAKRKEFELSEEVPTAALEYEHAEAVKRYNERRDAAEASVRLPASPYRVRGDASAGRWYAEEASAEVREQGRGDYDSMWMRLQLYGLYGSRTVPAEYYRAETARLDAATFKAKVAWCVIGRTEGYRTYARALKRLKEHLEPVRDESVYFRPDGSPA